MNPSPESKNHRALLEKALLAVEEMQSKLDAQEREKWEPIAIIGMACRFPGNADSLESFWRLLHDGVDATREVPPDRWDINAFYDPDPDAPGKMFSRRGGFLDEVDKFDPSFFGISPRETLNTDPQQRLLLEVSWEALENAALAPQKLMGSRTGVFIGITNNDYARVVERAGLRFIGAYHLTGSCLNFAAGRIAYVLGLQGPAMAVDTACSSSGVTVHLACQSLRNRECNIALAGGVNLILSPEISITSTKAKTLSPDGYCKTFDASANGYVRGEGCGIVILKRLSDALADGDSINAVIRGSAVQQDGASSGLTVPNKLAQEAVIREALLKAGVKPNQVDYVEAHGTGTPLGDPIEVRALSSVYRQGRLPTQPLAIGAVKTNLGHLESAAGVAGLIKVVLSLQHGIIPPHLHFKNLNPAITLEDIPAFIPTTGIPWVRRDRPRLAGLSFFGGSGTIAHMIVEEAPDVKAAPECQPRSGQLFCLSAKSPTALMQLADRHEDHLRTHPASSLPDVCYTVNTGRAHFHHRLAIVGSSVEELRTRLLDFKAGRESAGLSWAEVKGAQAPKIVFLFTGQGGQYLNMGRGLYQEEPIFRHVVDRCDELLRPHLGRPLLSVLYPQRGEPTPLDETAYTHVAMFAIQFGLAQLWRSWGIEPRLVMGHSVGEIVAAAVAGILSLEDGLMLMRERGRLMQSLPAAGMMASLLAGEAQVAAALEPYRDRVAIAAVNGPESTVISGERFAVKAILQNLEAQGIKTKPLKVSNSFHSPLVEPILDEFEHAAARATLHPPKLAMFSSMRLELLGDQKLPDAAYWRANLRDTVRFSAAIRALYDQGYRTFLEIGPSPILVNMGSQCVPPGAGVWLASLREGRDDHQQMLESLGSLYTGGVDVNWDGFYQDQPRHKLALPTYPFQRERYWIESPAGEEPPAGIAAAKDPRVLHPLLGRRLRSAAPLFEHQISAARLPYLNDHRVHDKPVLPATAYLELALAAAAEVFDDASAVVQNLVISQPLVISNTEEKTIQVALSDAGPGFASFKIYSLNPDGEEKSALWRLHAAGNILTEEPGPPSPQQPPFRPNEVQKRCPEKVNVETYYERLRAQGLEFGPDFKGIEELWRQNGEALGLIRLPAALSAEKKGYLIHPVLLDACLQPIIAALPQGADSKDSARTYLPYLVQYYKVHRRPGDRVWSHIRIRTEAGQETDQRQADIDIFSQTGELLAEVKGLTLRRASREALTGSERDEFEEWLYEIKWKADPRLRETRLTAAASLADPQAIGQKLELRSARNRSEPALQAFTGLFPHLEKLSTLYVLKAFREMGWKLQDRQRFTLESKAAELGILGRHNRLLGRMFEMLQEDGVLRRDDQGWEVSRAPTEQDPDQLLAELLRQYPDCSAELMLTGRSGQHLAPAMRGEYEPLELLFPNGSLDDAKKLYRDSPYFRFYNLLIEEVVLAAIGKVPADRSLKILEIGAGTGSTTSYLLSKLPPRQTEYVFTDVSNLFIARARDAFAGYPFITYQFLDIERDPAEQGFAAHVFDIVIAANVLHATTDLRRTLQQVQTLLAPQGLLVLLEGTKPLRFADMIVGLMEGWWKFSDTDLRPSYPLVSAERWQELLSRAGFSAIYRFPEHADPEDVLASQALILARGPRTVSDNIEPNAPALDPRGSWLIFADEGGLAENLGERLTSSGENCLIVHAGDGYEIAGGGHVRIDAAGEEDFQRLLREVERPKGTGMAGIIYFWALDPPPRANITDQDPSQDIWWGCGRLLRLVKALVSRGDSKAIGLWLITRGAYAVAANEESVALAQAPVSALGNTIALEYPEISCIRIDLDPVACPEEALDLWDVIRAGKDETLVAFRQRLRHVARLTRGGADSVRGPHKSGAERTSAYRLQTSCPGLFDNLALRSMTRRPPGRGEVEIKVFATGLNFRDVLMALGRYPGDSRVFGYECTGEILTTGEGVEEFQAGESVMVVAPGCFASHLTVSADLIMQIPKSLERFEATTIPSAFLTAYYALCRLGKIAAGDRVLIHAAAGGVGLAAVQLALRAGAEIFASAGSPEKRAYLKSLGVDHVLDSRSLEFADHVMAITGGRGVDLLLNSLAGEFIPKSFSIMATDGRFLEIGMTGIWDAAQVARLDKNISYFPINLAESFQSDPKLVGSLLKELLPEFEQGRLKPLPYKVFPIAQAEQAFRYMAAGRHIGKIVVAHDADGGRPRPESASPSAGKTSLNTEASYLITGGLAGLGLLFARWMVERGARHLVLMGRSGASAEARAAIRDLEQKGAEVLVVQGDVSRPEHLAGIFSKFGQSWPPLRGLVHSAGLLEDGVLLQQNKEHFEKVLAPKAGGAWHLHALTREMSLDFFVMFSSAVSLLGSAGQANHVAACAFEDGLAHYRRALGLPALSIDWGPWAEIGAAVRHQVTQRLEMKGFRVIEPHRGLRIFEHLLEQDLTQVGVLSVNWRQYIEALPPGYKPALLSELDRLPASSQKAEPSGTAQPIPLRLQLSQAAPNKRRGILLKHVRELATKVLGFGTSFKLDPQQGLTALGMDSLMTIELKNRLQASLGKTLSSTLVFDHPTAAALAEYLEKEVLGFSDDTERPTGTGFGGGKSPEVTDLEPLSDAEAAALLSKELSEPE